MSTKSDMMRVFTVGSQWTRVHHQNDSHCGQEVVEKGQPIKLKVITQNRNEGIVFELPSGEHSWLSWPKSEWIDGTVTPNLVTFENRYGKLLTYTRDASVAEAVVQRLLDSEEPEEVMNLFKKTYPIIPTHTFRVFNGRQAWLVDMSGKVLNEIMPSSQGPNEYFFDVSGFDVQDYAERQGTFPNDGENIALSTIAYYGPSGQSDRHKNKY